MKGNNASKTVSGLTLIEVTMAMGLLGVFGIAVYSMLNIGMILGAKNTAVNTAHQQARTAMLQMIQDLHSAVSLPALIDVNGAALVNPAPNTAAPGISFQLWSAGPYQICADSAAGSSTINIQTPNGSNTPVVGQRVIVQGHRIEEDITQVTSLGGGVYRLTLANPLTNAIAGTGSPTFYNISCFPYRSLLLHGQERFAGMEWPDDAQIVCDAWERHHKPNPFYYSKHTGRRALLSLRRRDQSLHLRQQIRQARFQVR